MAKKLLDRVGDLGRDCFAGVADAARNALQHEATRARGELVASLWRSDHAAAAEAYRVLGETEPTRLIELASTIVEAVPILQRFVSCAPEGEELADRLQEHVAAMRRTPPREGEHIDQWIADCRRIEQEAHAARLKAAWATAAANYLARTKNRFPALADDPRWAKADNGPVTFEAFERAQRLFEKTTCQEVPTRLVDGVLRSVTPPPPRRRVRVKSD